MACSLQDTLYFSFFAMFWQIDCSDIAIYLIWAKPVALDALIKACLLQDSLYFNYLPCFVFCTVRIVLQSTLFGNLACSLHLDIN